MIIIWGIVLFLLYIFGIKLQYWKRRGVEQVSIFLLCKCLFKILLGQPLTNAYLELFKTYSNRRYLGMYFVQRPFIMVNSPELVKKIFIEDFSHFTDHVSMVPVGSEPLWDKNVFNLKGSQWKKMRSMISGCFTNTKLKTLFGLVDACAQQFMNHLKGERNVEISNFFARYSSDVIASVVFGASCNSFNDPKNEFFMKARSMSYSIFRIVILWLVPLLSKLGLKVVSPDLESFCGDVIKQNLEIRRKNNIERPDLIHLLMHTTEELTDEDITSQAFIFFQGGFDTAAIAMSFMAYELALNRDIQKRLQEEVDTVLHSGFVDFDRLKELKYMDMVISETLRKWPPATIIDIQCVKPYTMEGEDLTINKGDVVMIPVYGIHRDPENFPEPDEFIPERFSEENKNLIDSCAYIPFGQGPRKCLGYKLATLQIKVIFTYFLTKYDIFVTNKTHVPMKVKHYSLDLQTDGVWLEFVERNNKN